MLRRRCRGTTRRGKARPACPATRGPSTPEPEGQLAGRGAALPGRDGTLPPRVELSFVPDINTFFPTSTPFPTERWMTYMADGAAPWVQPEWALWSSPVATAEQTCQPLAAGRTRKATQRPRIVPNPYQVTKPVGPSEVIDRDQGTSRLVDRALEENNARLVAPRRFGKTSLLNRVRAQLENEGWNPPPPGRSSPHGISRRPVRGR
jgi:hypothetical protein